MVPADGNVLLCGPDLPHHGPGKHHKHTWLHPGAYKVIQHTDMQVPLTLARWFLADPDVVTIEMLALCLCMSIVTEHQLDSFAQAMLLPCAWLDNIVAGCQSCGLLFVSLPASATALVHVQVCVDQYVQFIWFPMKLAGYTCMIIVRFDVILGSRVTKARTDVLCMLVALSASIGLALPLAKVYHLDYVPPIAVATAGTVYLAMHFLGRLTQREQQPQASSGYCACAPTVHACMLHHVQAKHGIGCVNNLSLQESLHALGCH